LLGLARNEKSEHTTLTTSASLSFPPFYSVVMERLLIITTSSLARKILEHFLGAFQRRTILSDVFCDVLFSWL